MGLLDFLNKAKETVNVVKEKAVQTVKENIPSLDKVNLEEWESLDPLILNAILQDNDAYATDLYAKQTGCTPEKAKSTINRIKRSVKEEYPTILQSQADIEAIKDVWPFGAKKFDMYLISKETDNENKHDVIILSSRLKSNGKGEYKLCTSSNTHFKHDLEWTVIFKNGKMFLKDKSGNITIVDSFTIDYDPTSTLLFNPEDERYKLIASKVKSCSRIKSLHLYRKTDFEQYKQGKMDKETLTQVADSFTFTFDKGSISSQGCNIGELLKDDYYFKAGFIAKKEGLEPPYDYFTNPLVFDYINNIGIRYAWDEEGLANQLRQFNREIKPIVNIGITEWNLYVYGVAGMVYKGLLERINQSSIPVEIFSVTWDEKKTETSFILKESVFSYNIDKFDGRPLLDRVIGYNNEDMVIKANAYAKLEALMKGIILKVLQLMSFDITIVDEDYVSVECLSNEYCGFIEDVEYN